MKLISFITVHRGIFYLLLCSILLTTTASISKSLKAIPSGQFTGTRGFFCFQFTFLLAYFIGYQPFKLRKVKWVYLYNTFRVLGYILKIFCIANMPMGDASALYFTSPIYAGIFARIFLKEPWGIFHAVSTVLGMSSEY